MLNASPEGGARAERGTPSPAAPDADVDDLRTLTETAQFFGVSENTVSAWLKSGCPAVEEGRHGKPWKLSLRAVADWKRARDRNAREAAAARRKEDEQLALELLGGEQTTLGGDKAAFSAKDLKEVYEAEKKRAEIAELRGELVRADEIQATAATAFRQVRDRLLQMPDDLVREHGLTEAQADHVENAINNILRDLADDIASELRAPTDVEH